MSEKQFERAELPARFFKLYGNKAYLGKRMQKVRRTRPGWRGKLSSSDRKRVETLGVVTLKTYRWQL